MQIMNLTTFLKFHINKLKEVTTIIKLVMNAFVDFGEWNWDYQFFLQNLVWRGKVKRGFEEKFQESWCFEQWNSSEIAILVWKIDGGKVERIMIKMSKSFQTLHEAFQKFCFKNFNILSQIFFKFPSKLNFSAFIFPKNFDFPQLFFFFPIHQMDIKTLNF